jgi:flagellin
MRIMALNAIHNFGASVAGRSLRATSTKLSLTLAQMSAGKRVISARDDAAALAIGSRLTAETAALTQALSNAGQGGAMLRIADGGMARTTDILGRMRQLAVQAGSDHLSSTERSALNEEFQALGSEVDRIAADTEFAGTGLLDGSAPAVDIKVGTGTGAEDDIALSFDDASSAGLGLTGANILSAADADAAIGAIDGAINVLQTARAGNGAAQNRLDFAASNIATTLENTEAARSNLLDLDMAKASGELSSLQARYQAGVSAFKSANAGQAAILRLLI